MSRLMTTFIYGNPIRTSVRGKCGYWGHNLRHESVQLVDGQWMGEDSYSYECPYARLDQCSICGGTGEIQLTPAEMQLAQYDGNTTGEIPRKPCLPCGGKGWVPGPHWPYRFPEPPPLRVKKG